MTNHPIVFSRPYRSGKELDNLYAVLESGHVHGDGAFTLSATRKLSELIGAPGVLLTTSGSHALEMASLLLDIGPGDEVILPSFTFPSAANAVALTGARCVFVDIDPETGNIDPATIERNITMSTRAISVMHYGGVAVDLRSVLEIAGQHGLPVIEDNAHGLGVAWEGERLGTIGAFGIQSFHDTKNIQSGEGGALLIKDSAMIDRAEVIREKGTDRARTMRGGKERYSWTDIGSSYLPSELNAAVLDAQLDDFDIIQSWRHRVWERYAAGLAAWAHENSVVLMRVPKGLGHSAHLFYMLMPNRREQARIIEHLRQQQVIATFHYVPLDSSPAGRRFGRTPNPCVQSHDFSNRLVRLPLWAGMPDASVGRVIEAVNSYRVAGEGAL